MAVPSFPRIKVFPKALSKATASEIMGGSLKKQQEQKVMLVQGKKIILYLTFLLACQNESVYIISKDMRNISSKQIGESIYETIYNKANDSLNIWINNELKSSLNLKVNTWYLDSLLCFNRNSDKLIGSVSVQLTKYADTDHDGMYYFYGVRIKDEWYFFFGPYLVLKRENYPPFSLGCAE